MSDTNLKEKLLKINELVNPAIEQLLTRDVETKNQELVKYQCAVGGKRIRPAMVVFSGQVFGCNVDELIYPAAAIEILHNATLIVDDIIDHSEFRRDQPTTWKEYGTSIAQCVSFSYISSIFSGLSHVKNNSRLIDLYNKALKTIIDGEIKDILFERSGRDDENFVVENRYKEITKNDYFEMISGKTAILLQACCEAGAICADATDEQVNTVGKFGFNLGMAFQIRDDILDIFGDEKEFGKKIGKDIIEKKMGNFVILSAMNQLDETDKQIICNLFEGSNSITDDDIKTVINLITKTNAKQTADETAAGYIDAAFELLKKLPKNESAEKLGDIASYIINRSK